MSKLNIKSPMLLGSLGIVGIGAVMQMDMVQELMHLLMHFLQILH
jgi:hypothetical protein